MPKPVSCGVIVTDGERLLLGHATRTPRWDIPKGIAEPGEAHAVAALRELAEETGLLAPAAALIPLGLMRYRQGKALALFLWTPPDLPDPAGLRCVSTFVARDGAVLPEFDRFGLFTWEDALRVVGTSMARVLAELRTRPETTGARR